MNRAITLLLLVFFSYLSIFANIRVLSIGISEYPESSRWNRINADNDVHLMKNIFPDAVILENKNATCRDIEIELKRIVLNAAKGDTVIIHFSGHGQQIITEKSIGEIDKVDEAIVPYDAAKHKSSSYTGESHLTDDAFGKAIDNIRKAIGPTGLVIALIDACHSDSMDRDTKHDGKIYRGTDDIFGSEDMTDDEILKIKDTYHNQEEYSLNESPEMSNAIYLSACKSDRRNYEIVVDDRGYGSLTYYFGQAYRGKGLGDLNKFLSAIYDGMKSDKTLQFYKQVPMIRNTIGWKTPAEDKLKETDNKKKTEDSGKGGKDHNDLSPILIWSMIASAFSVIFIALWITRKKKK